MEKIFAEAKTRSTFILILKQSDYLKLLMKFQLMDLNFAFDLLYFLLIFHYLFIDFNYAPISIINSNRLHYLLLIRPFIEVFLIYAILLIIRFIRLNFN